MCLHVIDTCSLMECLHIYFAILSMSGFFFFSMLSFEGSYYNCIGGYTICKSSYLKLGIHFLTITSVEKISELPEFQLI